MLPVFLKGFTSTFVLIMAIGAQNAFVLRQGVLKQHVFWICLFCVVSDAVLILLGVLGFDQAVSYFPQLPRLMSIFGAIFLVGYSLSRLYAAWQGQYTFDTTAGKQQSLLKTLLTLAALTWLNPHVYLDTVGLIGAISTDVLGFQNKLIFLIGAIIASFSFFFSLGYGARFLAPVMQSVRAWQVLDTIIAFVMFALAFMLSI